MARCNVIARRQGKKLKNRFIDNAADERDAIQQFRKEVSLPKVAEITISVDWMGAPPPSPIKLAKPDEDEPDEGDPIVSVETLSPTTDASPPAAPPPAADTVGVLIAHGATANDIADLQRGGLGTVEAVVAYAKQHGDLTSIAGIGPKSDERIEAAYTDWQGARE